MSITKTTLIATLSADELDQWQRIIATTQAILDTQGRQFTKDEAIQAQIDKFQFLARVKFLYGLDDQFKWNVSLYSGEIRASDEEYPLD